MAPKKKARGPSRPASSPSANAIEDAPFTKDTSAKTGARFPLLQDDGWTDDQESVLFKGMIRWKPVGWAISSPFSTALTKSPRGVHKHFRIIAISQYLQSHGYTPLEHEHTRIPHIWKKLESLYNLEALDDRENAFSRASSPDTEGTEMPSHQFTLPHDDFGKMMFERRLAPEGSSSPPASTRPPSAGSTSAAATGRASTIEDTEDFPAYPDRDIHLKSLDQYSAELPSLDVPSEDPLQVSKCLEADQYGESYFSYGPLEKFETIELSSASSASSDQEEHGDPDGILGALWSDKEIRESIVEQIQVMSWERRCKNSLKSSRRMCVADATHCICGAPSGYALNSVLPVAVSDSDAILSSLVQVTFGRDSMIYRYHEKERTFRPVDEGLRISGYTPQIFHGLTESLVEYGNQIRRAKDFSERMRQSKDSTVSLVALASGVDITIRALETQMSASFLSVQTILELQTLLDPLRIVLESISSVLFVADQAYVLGNDSILLSQLYEILQDPENSAPQLRPVMSELLAHVSRPWLEAVEASIGLREELMLGAFPLMNIQSQQPNECNPAIAAEVIEAGENVPRKMPVFVSTELTGAFLEAVDSLQLLRAYEPQHPLAQVQKLTFYKPPSFKWHFSWQDIERVKTEALDYEADVLQAIKRFQVSGRTSHQTFESQSEVHLESHEDVELSVLLLDIEAPVSGLLTGSQSHLATNVTQTVSGINSTSLSSTTPPMSLVPTLSFSPMITAQSRLLSYSTLHLLFHVHCLRFHLRLLRSYLLFGNGPFLVHISHALFNPTVTSVGHREEQIPSHAGTEGLRLGVREAWPPRSSELRTALMECLTESYHLSAETKLAGDPHKARTDNADLPGELSFAIRSDMSEQELGECMNADGLEALDFLKVHYRPPNSLDAIITDIVLEKYDRVSRLLMRVAMVGWVVKEMLREHRDSGLANPRSRLTQRYKMEVHHFVTTVFAYFGDSIEVLWTAFETRLDEIEASINSYEVGQHIEGVHRLKELHEEVLDRILASCLLRKRQELVMNLLGEILGLVLQFSCAVRRTKGDEEVRELYETWKTKIRVFITVCRGLQDQASGRGEEDVLKSESLGDEKGNGIGRLVLRLEMNGWYMR
ncbi:MAG: hypothetical protein Q9215_003314 [Flavoplaca cf. flavocitrina]